VSVAKRWWDENCAAGSTTSSPGKTRRTMYHVDQVRAVAMMAFNAGFRRGACAAKGTAYPDGYDLNLERHLKSVEAEGT
jgi:hypothetical protein